MATPFVQGHLQDAYLAAVIETACAHCGRPIHIRLDSAMRYRVDEPGAQPLVFEPDVDFNTLADPNIIHAY
jgi:hypothetical protein